LTFGDIRLTPSTNVLGQLVAEKKTDAQAGKIENPMCKERIVQKRGKPQPSDACRRGPFSIDDNFHDCSLLDRTSVPAMDFTNGKERERSKVPPRIVMKDRQLFTFAGLWDMWRDQEGDDLYTFTIITTNANALLGPIHHRMPHHHRQLGRHNVA
jgi:putative SOS response-associated peptidase YedK